MLFDQVSQQIDIIRVREARAGIDLQSREGIIVGQADLENREVTLQPLLLIDDQIGPTAANGSVRASTLGATGSRTAFRWTTPNLLGT